MDTLKWVQNLKKSTDEPLLRLFFDPINFKFLNVKIVELASTKAQMTVSPQDPGAVLNLMVRVYDNFERCQGLRENLAALNSRFVKISVDKIVQGINDYKHYYRAASTLATPISNPANVSSKGHRALRN